MKVLGVDTALGACSVAILDGEKILSQQFVPMARGHAEALAPMAADVMRDAGLGFDALDRLAVTTGPGTFTGQRVGLAFMRGLKLALKKPLVGVTSMEAMAVATQKNKVAVIHDARRDEAYLLFWDGGVVLEPMVMGFAAAIEEIRSFSPQIIAGTGAAQAAAQTSIPASEITQPDALWVARLAMTRNADDAPPAPLYLRAPDAKLPGGKTL